MNCPHCGKVINAAQILAHERMSKLSKAKRKEIATTAAKTRWKKGEKVVETAWDKLLNDTGDKEDQ